MSKKPTSQNPKGSHSKLTVAASMKDAPQDNLDFKLRNSPSTSQRFTKRALGKLGDIFVKGRRNEQSEAKKELAAENAKQVSAAREKAAEKKELAEAEKAKKRTEFLEEKAKYKAEIAKKLAENRAKDDARKAKLKKKALGEKNSEELAWENEFFDESDRAYTPPLRAYTPPLDEARILVGGDLDGESSSDEELSEIEDARQKKRNIFKELDEESLAEEEVRKKFNPSPSQLLKERDRENTPPKKVPVRKNLSWTPTILHDIEEVRETSIEEDRKKVFDRVFAAIEDNLRNKFGNNHEASFDNIREPFEEAWMKTMKMGKILKKQGGGIEEALNVMWPGFAKDAGEMFFSLNPKEIEAIGGIFTDAQANAMAEICYGVKGYEIEIEDREQRIPKQDRKLILGVVKELRNEIIAPAPSSRPSKTNAGRTQEPKYDGPSCV